MYDEFTPQTAARAVCLDTPAVQLDQAPHERQPDAQATKGPVEGPLRLYEQVKYVRQHFRADADATITYPQDDLAAPHPPPLYPRLGK